MAEPPEKIRTFAAIYPPSEIINELQSTQAFLQKDVAADAVRWTKPEQIHLTLQFLGYIKRDLLDLFQSALDRVCQETCCFEMCAKAVGCFPSSRRPRIIWAGLTGELDGLETLKGKLDAAFGGLGYAPEERKFHPHLTIGRVANLKTSDARRLAKGIAEFKSKQFGGWQVRRINLMQSILSPKGAKYELLKSFPLKTI
jgi:RNA 2',3'-cyclic 3'-phosphodiesterase